MKRSLLLFTIFILNISCGNSEKSKEGISSSIFKSEIDSPCEILSESEIKDALGIPADAETTMEEKERTFPMCKYKWESVPFSGTVELPGIVKTKKSISQPKEMYITMLKDMTDKQFEQATSYYKDGVSLEGIGEMAKWSAKKRQVTFLADGYLVHVYLRTSSDEAVNKDEVIKMAKLISGKF
ncbi:hypothetical protein [Aequorivita capsosiphonis]|uniref:hypothetical protein n=1 Tax=Aequorivita capsosiphonis TaxID=487317 RepID=UPI0003FB0D56|nr:hypothetical protein [Aequorivita capsosiphonis]